MDPNAGALAEIERQLRHASFFTQASLEQQGKLAGKLDAYLTGLIDVLLKAGVVDAEDLRDAVEANRAEQAEQARARFEDDGKLPAWPTVLVREDQGDDTATVAAVDCEARLPICKAACCSLPFALSAAEVEEGRIRWELGHPYMIRHTDEGYCVHNDRATGGCEVYDCRPSVCRGYSCAEDERIWADFDNMVLNEEFLADRARPDFHFHPSTTAVPVTIGPAGRRPDRVGSPR